MNQYIKSSDTKIYEIGCGIGLGKEFIQNPNMMLTDVIMNEWIDRKLDALALDMPDDSVDVFIMSNVLHHFAYPLTFFKNAYKKLKPGGRIILFEPHMGLLLKVAQRILGLEGWDEDTDVYDESVPCNEKDKPWSANNAIPDLFFKDISKFEKYLPGFKVKKYALTECFMFLLSGGVNFHTWHIPFNDRGCRLIRKVDKRLVKMCPSVFALGSKIVIQKIK